MSEWAKNPTDIVKVAIVAFIMIYFINMGLRGIGLASLTTKGS